MRYFFSLFFLLAFLSCSQPQRHNEIIKVELARSGAWADWGAALSIDTSLQYHYTYYLRHGHALRPGYYVGKASREFWDSLVVQLNDVKYKAIDSTENRHIEDVNYFELLVKSEKGKRRIIRVRDHDSKDSVSNMLEWLNASWKNMQLQQSAAPFKFETTFQNPPDWKSIGIDIEKMGFLPPVKRKRKSKH